MTQIYLDANILKRLQTEARLEWTTSWKWHTANRMVMWSITSRVLEKWRSWPQYVWAQNKLSPKKWWHWRDSVFVRKLSCWISTALQSLRELTEPPTTTPHPVRLNPVQTKLPFFCCKCCDRERFTVHGVFYAHYAAQKVMICSTIHNAGWAKKVNPKCSTHNFVKYWPILKILSLLQSPENLQCNIH